MSAQDCDNAETRWRVGGTCDGFAGEGDWCPFCYGHTIAAWRGYQLRVSRVKRDEPTTQPRIAFSQCGAGLSLRGDLLARLMLKGCSKNVAKVADGNFVQNFRLPCWFYRDILSRMPKRLFFYSFLPFRNWYMTTTGHLSGWFCSLAIGCCLMATIGCGGSSDPTAPSKSEVEQFLEANPELNKTTPQVEPEPYKL